MKMVGLYTDVVDEITFKVLYYYPNESEDSVEYYISQYIKYTSDDDFREIYKVALEELEYQRFLSRDAIAFIESQVLIKLEIKERIN